MVKLNLKMYYIKKGYYLASVLGGFSCSPDCDFLKKNLKLFFEEKKPKTLQSIIVVKLCFRLHVSLQNRQIQSDTGYYNAPVFSNIKMYTLL